MKKWILAIILLANVTNLGLQYITLNVNTRFKVTCNDETTFRYETGFGSGCSASYRSMTKCFESWKSKNNVTSCELLRTERINLILIHKWLEYIVMPKWHHSYTEP